MGNVHFFLSRSSKNKITARDFLFYVKMPTLPSAACARSLLLLWKILFMCQNAYLTERSLRKTVDTAMKHSFNTTRSSKNTLCLTCREFAFFNQDHQRTTSLDFLFKMPYYALLAKQGLRETIITAYGEFFL